MPSAIAILCLGLGAVGLPCAVAQSVTREVRVFAGLNMSALTKEGVGRLTRDKDGKPADEILAAIVRDENRDLSCLLLVKETTTVAGEAPVVKYSVQYAKGRRTKFDTHNISKEDYEVLLNFLNKLDP